MCQFLAKVWRSFLDCFFNFRRWLGTLVTFLSIHLLGSEVSWEEIKSGKIKSSPHFDRDLEAAQDLDLLLGEAKSRLEESEARRSTVVEKCKTLLTLSSFVLTAAGLVLSKISIIGGPLQASLLFSILFLLHVVILLSMHFAVRSEMQISIDQADVGLSPADLRKSLFNSYLRCQVDRDSRVDFLLEIYKSARFFFFLGLLMLIVVLSFSFLRTNDKLAANVASELMKDPHFVDSIRAEHRSDLEGAKHFERREVGRVQKITPADQSETSEPKAATTKATKEVIPRDSTDPKPSPQPSKDSKRDDGTDGTQSDHSTPAGKPNPAEKDGE